MRLLLFKVAFHSQAVGLMERPFILCRTQACIQVLRFGGHNTFLGGQYFCFMVCLKQIILLIFSD